MDKFFLKKYFFLSLLASLILLPTGCVPLVVGGAAVMGGYAISPDTIEGNLTGYTSQDVWAVAVEVISIMGIIDEKDELSGVLIAKVQGTRVTVTVTEPFTDNVKLRVKARKGMMPKIKLAQDIYTKIVQKAHP